MPAKKRLSIRFDDHTLLQLSEVCEMTGEKLSVIVRTLIRNSLSQITDRDGQIHLPRHDKEKE